MNKIVVEKTQKECHVFELVGNRPCRRRYSNKETTIKTSKQEGVSDCLERKKVKEQAEPSRDYFGIVFSFHFSLSPRANGTKMQSAERLRTNLTEYRHRMRHGCILYVNGPSNGIMSCF